MRLTGWRVVALALLYLILIAVASGAAVLHRVKRMSERFPGGYIETIPIPVWWWVLLGGPPLVLLALWLRHRARRAATHVGTGG